MSMNLGPLFEPFELHNLKLRNRVAMAPMTRNFSPKGVPGQDVVDYYRRRAEAGVGLIITEGTVVNHAAANGYPNVPAFYGDEAWRAGRKWWMPCTKPAAPFSRNCGTWARYARKVSSRIPLFPVTALQACLRLASPTARP